MKRNSIGPMIGAATAALVMVGCATTRSAQDAPPLAVRLLNAVRV